jgi:hypothetical protein
MGVERFDVLLRDATSGGTIKREWTKAEMLRSVAWLKRMNARGNNVYVRPSGAHALVLLASLRTEHLNSMRSKGFAPAISIEVTGKEFQAWVKLSDRTLPEPVRRLTQARLVSGLVGEETQVVGDGYGRLAGCTDHGDGPDSPGRGRYILAHAGTAEIGHQAKAYVDHFKMMLEGVAKEQGRQGQTQRHSNPIRPRTRGR